MMRAKNGSVLVALLWCFALLSVVVVGTLHSSRLDLMAGKNQSDRIKARYLAMAGIEKAKALLYQNGRDRSRASLSHSSELWNKPEEFRDIRLGAGTFRVFRSPLPSEGDGFVFGVDDEESRLNLNAAPTNELFKLEGMTPDIMAAIVDWRDGDNLATPGGAEAEYYASLTPPQRPRNGPFLTTRELLFVRGLTPELLYGQRSMPRQIRSAAPPPARQGGGLAWDALITVHSGVSGVDASGQSRLNLQTASERELTEISGITEPIAKAIVAHRGRNQFQSIADLLDVRQAGPGGAANAGGPSLISEDLFLEIADRVTTSQDGEGQGGEININSAPVEVLTCLPGIERQTAQAILNQRQSAGPFKNIAWLLRVPGISRDIFKQLVPRVTARSETFRITAEGKVESSGVRQRVQCIVRVNTSGVSTLAYREDDL